MKENAIFAGDLDNKMDDILKKRIEANKKEYARLLKDNNYDDVSYSHRTGGLMAVHKGHKKNSPKEETYFNGLTSIDLEKECQRVLFKNGYSCVLENENIRDATGKLLTTLDSTTNGMAMDIRSATKNALSYRNMLDEKNNQLEKYNGRADVKKSNSVILYFHDASFYDKQKVNYGFAAISKILSAKGMTNHIKEIICVVSDGRIVHFKY